MSVSAHCLVKNESNFVWYAVTSVIDKVDKVLLWDTGSTDGTVKIIKELKRIYKDKIDLELLDKIDPEGFTEIRQRMLDKTKTDWFVVVDGDEIWWDDSITKLIKNMKVSVESLVVPTINLVGDIFHYQEEAAGNYNLAGRCGHLNLRGVKRSIPGLASDKPHGTWGWIDESGKMIQDRDPKKVIYVNAPYLHATFLQRSGDILGDKQVPKRAQKLKAEIGTPFPSDYYYPEMFFRSRPSFVPSPWRVMDRKLYYQAIWQTPLRKIKRRLLPGGVGY